MSNRTQAEASRRHPFGVLKRLSDGAPILIRPIRPDDKRMLQDGLRQLSRESVQRRFLTPKRSFSRSELRYLTEVDGRDHVALVAESEGHAIAVARFVRSGADPAVAEVAFVVADAWHRRGVGSALTEVLADEARRRGIRRFTATMGSDNLAARRLLRNLTTELESRHTGGGISEVALELAA